jgi:hypothetical protein
MLMLYSLNMKKKLIFIVLAGVITTILAMPTVVNAVEAQKPVSAETKTEDQKRTNRVEEYKKTFKQTLTDANKTRIDSRCVASQSNIKGKVTSNSEVMTNRTKYYNEITSNLHILSVALAAKGVNVTTLDADLLVLQSKITTFSVLNAAYSQALSDVSLYDCKTDPIGFKASLDAARSAQDALSKSSKDIRMYLNDTVKPLLATLKVPQEKIK